MRIVVSCLQSEFRHPGPAYDFWRGYFVRGLEEVGHDVAEVPGVDWAEGLFATGAQLETWRGSSWQRTLDFLFKEPARRPFDLFLSYLYPWQVDEGAVQEIQRRGVPCVNFFCDNVREFRTIPAEYRPFTLHWVPEAAALTKYQAAGLPHIHAPMPCWVPPEYRSVPEVESEPPTFIGSTDLLRRNLFGKALALGANIVLRGRGWQDDGLDTQPQRGEGAQLIANQMFLVRQHGLSSLAVKLFDNAFPISQPPIDAKFVGPLVPGDAEYFRVTREAEVTLGIGRVPTPRASNRWPLSYSRLRDIEAPMLGACYLTEWTQGIEALYDVGRDIETYRSAEELKAKLDELQKNPARRRELRRQAQSRALNDHTVGRTISHIAERLGL